MTTNFQILGILLVPIYIVGPLTNYSDFRGPQVPVRPLEEAKLAPLAPPNLPHYSPSPS
jgi:hypothetical protein